jgi:hypothetical protein
MSEQNSTVPPVLESAWKRFADYDKTAENHQDQYQRLRRWVLYFSVAATFIAIIIENFRYWFTPILVTSESVLVTEESILVTYAPILVRILQVILIALPISGSVIIAYLSEFKQGQKYLAMRTGAEEIKKEIYLFRTVMQAYPIRKKWLNNRIAEIQRQVHRSSGGEVVVKPYKGNYLNPYYDPKASYPSDEGGSDLTADEYMTLRLEDQLNWHTRKIEGHQKQRQRFIILILVAGGVGSLLASIDFILSGIAVWVALATAISSAITNWKELLGLDMIVSNYSKVILELNILRDHWLSLEPHEQTQQEFFKTVRATENLLWGQQTRFTSAMRESMDEAEAEQQKIVEDMIEMSREVAGQVQEQIIEEARRSMEEAASAGTDASSGLPIDNERLPAGAIFSAVLGPVESVIVGDDEVDAPDGFEDDENTSTQVETSLSEDGMNLPDDGEDEDITDF